MWFLIAQIGMTLVLLGFSVKVIELYGKGKVVLFVVVGMFLFLLSLICGTMTDMRNSSVERREELKRLGYYN